MSVTTVTIKHPGGDPHSLSICRVEQLVDGSNVPVGGIIELAPGAETDLKLTERMYFVIAQTPDGQSIKSLTGETS